MFFVWMVLRLCIFRLRLVLFSVITFLLVVALTCIDTPVRALAGVCQNGLSDDCGLGRERSLMRLHLQASRCVPIQRIHMHKLIGVYLYTFILVYLYISYSRFLMFLFISPELQCHFGHVGVAFVPLEIAESTLWSWGNFFPTQMLPGGSLDQHWSSRIFFGGNQTRSVSWLLLYLFFVLWRGAVFFGVYFGQAPAATHLAHFASKATSARASRFRASRRFWGGFSGDVFLSIFVFFWAYWLTAVLKLFVVVLKQNLLYWLGFEANPTHQNRFLLFVSFFWAVETTFSGICATSSQTFVIVSSFSVTIFWKQIFMALAETKIVYWFWEKHWRSASRGEGSYFQKLSDARALGCTRWSIVSHVRATCIGEGAREQALGVKAPRNRGNSSKIFWDRQHARLLDSAHVMCCNFLPLSQTPFIQRRQKAVMSQLYLVHQRFGQANAFFPALCWWETKEVTCSSIGVNRDNISGEDGKDIFRRAESRRVLHV